MNKRENIWIKLTGFKEKNRFSRISLRGTVSTTICDFHIDAMSNAKDTTPNLGVNEPPQHTGFLKRQKQFLGFLGGPFM